LERLFIYGTLAPGRVNHGVMEDIPGKWEKAVVKGKLLNEGWGADSGYPGIIPSDDGDEVEGYIFSSEHLSKHWAMLDDFEGSGYKRVLVIAKAETGENVESYVYALNKEA